MASASSILLISALMVIVPIALTQDASYIYQAEEECMGTHGDIIRDEIEHMKKIKKADPNARTEMKCFSNCVGERLRAIVGDDFIIETIKILLHDVTGGDISDEEAHDLATKCTTLPAGPDMCERTWDAVVCGFDELQDYRFHHTWCPNCNH